MEILNLGGSHEPSARPTKKKFKVVLGIGLLAGVLGLGSTLAATINLGTGSTVEFGQGISATTACDGDVTVVPGSTFVNAAGTAGDFQLTSITISDINSVAVNTGTGEGCGGQTFILHAYTDDDTMATNYAVGASKISPLYLGWNYPSVVKGGAAIASYKGFNSGIAVTIGETSEGSCTMKAIGFTAVSGTSDIGGATCAQSGISDAATVITISLGGNSATGGAKYGVTTAAVSKLTIESGAVAPATYSNDAVA